MPNLQARAALVAFQAINLQNGKQSGGTARVDSGADISLVDLSVLQSISATQTGSIEVQGIDGNAVQMPLYTIDLNFGNYGYIQNAVVAGDDGLVTRDGYQALVGTDLLSTGIFDYYGTGQTFNLQLGVSTGTPINEIPPWLLPGGIVAAVLGLSGITWMMTK